MLADIHKYVVRPALLEIGLAGLNREQQVLGTGLVESGYRHLDQTTPGPGPAFGFWQMEKATHDDLWLNFVIHRPVLFDALVRLTGRSFQSVEALRWNLRYGAAMCAVHYLRAPGKHPAEGDYEAMARYWKKVYNTPLGAGKVEHAIPLFKQAVSLPI